MNMLKTTTNIHILASYKVPQYFINSNIIEDFDCWMYYSIENIMYASNTSAKFYSSIIIISNKKTLNHL